MFTGIVEAIGSLVSKQPRGGDLRLQIDTGKLDLTDVQLGDSIATNGVCLTVVELFDKGFWADVSRETSSYSTLGSLVIGSPVNLEKALTPTTRLGGHIVSGHVDGVGTIVSRKDDARSVRIEIEAPLGLSKYIAHKGSICVDGVSLTVNGVHGDRFDLNIVPHTAEETTIARYVQGQQVNIEVDVIARYLESLLNGAAAESGEVSTLTKSLLEQHGFIK